MQTSIGGTRTNAGGLVDPQYGEPETGMLTLTGDVNPIDSGDGEEVQEG